MAEKVQRIRKILDHFATAVVVTHGTDGLLRGRPMALAFVEPNCNVWLITSRDSGKAQDIQANPSVLLCCEDERICYVSLSGYATVIEDPDRVRLLWRDVFERWIGESPEQGGLVLIRVRPVAAEFWEDRVSVGMRHVFTALEQPRP